MLGSLVSRPQNEVQIETSTWGSWPGDDTSPARKVDRGTALQLMAVYGSVRLITDGIATLPVDVFEADGTETVTPGWLEQPTEDLEYESWCSQVLTSLLLDGNAYLSVGRDRVGRVANVAPLDPAVVQIDREMGRGPKRYRVNGKAFAGEMVHIRGMMLPGTDEGLSPVEYARRTIGLGLNAVDFGADFFAGEGNMPGVIELPHAAQPGTMRDLANQWRRKRRTGGKGLPGVLQAGGQWKPTGVNHEQAQFLSTRKFTAAEIAGQMFLVDPTDLGIALEGSSVTYANLQQRNTRRVQVTFLPWIVRIERALSALTYRTKYVKLNVDGLLRGDPKTRYEQHGLAVDHKIYTPNEARSFEDLPPLEGGDEFPSPTETQP